MRSWPIPNNLKGLRGFLGLIGYYMKLIKNYSLLSRSLAELLRKDKFLWTPSTTIGFKPLKTGMTPTHVLALPNFSKPFILEIGASDEGIGAMLM
ncbi:UNVERIFIED_CONTAM: hypothetical protein Slati_1121200 [Sesamum latifolium]|uniref:Reverse transcriptase/retrotransposon-derived protein RNase H-like domain-containing protein n=1 Tax=Sesamum latifolium TaxID=2727402 RepID=A0AAW2XCL4_9LAMI